MKSIQQSLSGDPMFDLPEYHKERVRQCTAISRGFQTSAMRAYWQNLARFHLQCALGLYFDSRVSK